MFTDPACSLSGVLMLSCADSHCCSSSSPALLLLFCCVSAAAMLPSWCFCCCTAVVLPSAAFCCCLLLFAAVFGGWAFLEGTSFRLLTYQKLLSRMLDLGKTSRRCIVEQILGVFQITTDRRASLNTPSAQINANATRKGHERHFLTFCIENRCLGTQDSALVVLQVVSLRTPSTTSQTYPTKETPASGGNVQTNNIPLVAHSFFRFPS